MRSTWNPALEADLAYRREMVEKAMLAKGMGGGSRRGSRFGPSRLGSWVRDHRRPL
jgi:hypothetical protein